MRTIQKPAISTQSLEMLGTCFVSASTSAAAFPAANDALFIPFTLQRPALIKRLFSVNGNVAGNSLDMGIYTPDGARIVSNGGTVQAGVTQLQFLTIAQTLLTPNRYYLALAMNGTTGTFRRFNISIIRQQQFGVLKATSSYPLPASVTFATVTATYIPNIGMELLGIL